MKTEIINCDRCGAQIPDGPPNAWFQNTVVVIQTTNIANQTNDLCANCRGDYNLFVENQVVNPR